MWHVAFHVQLHVTLCLQWHGLLMFTVYLTQWDVWHTVVDFFKGRSRKNGLVKGGQSNIWKSCSFHHQFSRRFINKPTRPIHGISGCKWQRYIPSSMRKVKVKVKVKGSAASSKQVASTNTAGTTVAIPTACKKQREFAIMSEWSIFMKQEKKTIQKRLA